MDAATQKKNEHHFKYLVLVFGLALAVWFDAACDIWEIMHFDWYRVMQSDMPDQWVIVRWLGSMTLRIVTVLAVAGVVCRNDFYRRVLVTIGWINLVGVFLHHRYPSFIYLSEYLGLNLEDFRKMVYAGGHWYYPGAVMRMFNAYLDEIIIALPVIVILTRPKIKALFQ